MDALLKEMIRQEPEMIRMLRRFVKAESPSTDPSAVNRFGKIVAEAASPFSREVREVGSSRKFRTGNHLKITVRPPGSRRSGQVLLLGHLDTVWPLGTLKQMPFRISCGRAYGPGAFDMKGGIVQGFFAVRNLLDLGIPLKKKVVFLLTSDEEIKSPSSRALVEAEARKSDAVLVLEPSLGPRGSLKTSRKGIGEFQLQVEGRAAHSGLDPDEGASAILEIAKQIITVQSFEDKHSSVTINTGLISGGSRTNVVPEQAEATIEVRIVHQEDQQRVEKKLRSLKPVDRRTKLTVSGGFIRPPFEKNPQTAELFQHARKLAKSLGISLSQASVGGGSDGNFTAAVGIPTLDGLGAVGDGAHANHEHVVIDEMPRRAALLAHLIASLGS